MDADFKEKPRTRNSSDRRWSMNSQRLEEIVAELMRPIGDLRRSFDMDLSALLEEYLTEAGLHALEVDEDHVGADAVAPNFPELALLLQQSASIYGRKVDFLYQHVLNVSDSLHNSIEIARPDARVEEEEEQAPIPAPRRRRMASSGLNDFARIVLEPVNGALRDPTEEGPWPLPSLPRMYIELEPRIMAESDAPLTDYDGETIGLLADYHVSWRIQEGLLVDELLGVPVRSRTYIRPIPLVDLQRAIENAPAPPSPPREFTPPPMSPPLGSSTPIPLEETPQPPPPVRNERKRRSAVMLEDMSPWRSEIFCNEELRRRLSSEEEFSVPEEWVRAELHERAERVLRLRRKIKSIIAFRGFESSSLDINGFRGWTAIEAKVNWAQADVVTGDLSRMVESDDDGFFEQSSPNSSDRVNDTVSFLGWSAEEAQLNGGQVDSVTGYLSRVVKGYEDRLLIESPPICSDDHRINGFIHMNETALEARRVQTNLEEWKAGVARRAAEAEARGGVDVRVLGACVLSALPAAPATKTFTTVLRQTAKEPTDVSRLFLATLFLANAGNVEVVPGEPLSLNSFSLRKVSSDDTRLRAAAEAELMLR